MDYIRRLAAAAELDDAGAAAVAAASGFGAGLQWALWLPSFERQCCFWHSGLQYHAPPHRLQHLLTLSRPTTLQLTLAQRKSPAAEAFFFPILE